jgi:hypothetical protein
VNIEVDKEANKHVIDKANGDFLKLKAKRTQLVVLILPKNNTYGTERRSVRNEF